LEQIWLRELEELDRQYDLYKAKREAIQAGSGTKSGGAAAGAKKTKIKIVRKP